MSEGESGRNLVKKVLKKLLKGLETVEEEEGTAVCLKSNTGGS